MYFFPFPFLQLYLFLLLVCSVFEGKHKFELVSRLNSSERISVAMSFISCIQFVSSFEGTSLLEVCISAPEKAHGCRSCRFRHFDCRLLDDRKNN